MKKVIYKVEITNEILDEVENVDTNYLVDKLETIGDTVSFEKDYNVVGVVRDVNDSNIIIVFCSETPL